MKKIISAFSVVVISLFLLALFGWMSVHISKGDKDFGVLNEPVKFMYSFLDQFKETVEEVKEMPPTFLKTNAKHQSINNLKKDLIILTSHATTEFKRVVELKNLKDDQLIYQWEIPEEVRSHDRILNPVLYPNKDLVYFFDMTTGLRRIDSTGNVLWTQDSILVHHSLNEDIDGNLWMCSAKPPSYSASGKYKMYGRTVFFIDDFITQVDPNNGKILFHKSVAEIFKANQMVNYLLHSQSGKDPMHINDVLPAPKTTKYYEKGDLFISLKQISLIFQYRPSTNKVIRAIKGPFSAQHDVDFYNDSTLSWFNNNYYALWTEDSKPAPPNADNIDLTADFFSHIVQYDLSSEEFTFVGDSIFRANWIFTGNEGLHEFIDDQTYFVEQQNQGIIWVIENDKVLYRDVYKSQHEGYHHLPNWTRIIKY